MVEFNVNNDALSTPHISASQTFHLTGKIKRNSYTLTIMMSFEFLKGDGYHSLEYLYRIPKNTTNAFIPEVFEALYNKLKELYLKISIKRESPRSSLSP